MIAVAQETRFSFWLTIAIVAAVTLVRCAVLILSPLDLYPDEAQYWWWAQTPDFGYFSKPPMIAWIIALATALLGNAEWAIRIASPLFHAGTSILVFAIARRGLSPRLSLLSAVSYLTLPGVSYSSGLISTDAPLLFFWALALYAFLRASDGSRWTWPLLCGVALGLGLESKYAMLYFVVGAIAAAFLSPHARRLVFSPRAFLIVAIGLVLLAPNIAWNALHGFPTLAHTEANADWGRAHYSLTRAALFALGQFGVFGPLLLVGLIGALWRIAGGGDRDEFDVILASFTLPPLLLILVQAFIAGANANWAATAFVAATPLAVAELARWWRERLLWLSFVTNGLAMAVLWVILVNPASADAVGVGNAFKREEGWRALGTVVARTAAEAQYDSIAADNRSIMAELLYYARPRRVPIHAWARDLSIHDHFEMTLRLQAGTADVLLVVEPAAAPRVLATFDSATLLSRLDFRVGGRRTRSIDLYDAHHYRGPQSSPVRRVVNR